MSLKKAREVGRKVNQGAWIRVDPEAFPELAGMALHIRGINNRDFNRLQAKLAAGAKRNPKTGNVDQTESERVFDECLIETVVLDWKGLKEADDEPDIPFSKEKLRELLADDDVRIILRPAIVNAATEVRSQEATSLEADVKN